MVDLLFLPDSETSTGFIGITGNHLSSPVNGRQRACEAKLDVCFGPGHKEVPGSLTNCYSACQPGPGKDNVACTLEACESRCEAFFGFSDSCF